LGASGVDLPDERDAFLVVAVAKGARHSTDGFQFAFEHRLRPSRVTLWPDLQPVAGFDRRAWLDALHPVESFVGFVDLRRVGMIVSGGKGGPLLIRHRRIDAVLPPGSLFLLGRRDSKTRVEHCPDCGELFFHGGQPTAQGSVFGARHGQFLPVCQRRALFL